MAYCAQANLQLVDLVGGELGVRPRERGSPPLDEQQAELGVQRDAGARVRRGHEAPAGLRHLRRGVAVGDGVVGQDEARLRVVRRANAYPGELLEDGLPGLLEGHEHQRDLPRKR